MDQEIKARWVERLRSGEIPQGHKALGAISGERCCLGVLCDIAVEDGIIEAPVSVAGYPYTILYAGYSGLPAPVVYRWSGLDGGFAQDLAISNDNGATFEEIADLIEAGEE